MTAARKLIGCVTIAVFLSCLLLGAFTIWTLSILCTEAMVDQLVSPDGEYIATKTVRGCGATTSSSVSVELLRVRPRTDSTGNHRIVFLQEAGSADIRILWTDRSRLLIEYREGNPVTQEQPAWDGVEVEYRALNKVS
jgi:hypothetical protein